MALNIPKNCIFLRLPHFRCAHKFWSRAFFQNPDFLAREIVNCYYYIKNCILKVTGTCDKNGIYYIPKNYVFLRISHIGAPIISDHELFLKIVIFWPEILSTATTLPKIVFWKLREPMIKMALSIPKNCLFLRIPHIWCAHNFWSRGFFQNPDFLARDIINC